MAIVTLLLGAGNVAGSQSVRAQTRPSSDRAWVTTWAASPEPTWGGEFPLATGVPFHLWQQTVRQIARVSIGGSRVRIVISNAYGTQPLVVSAVHVARTDSGAAIVAGSDHTVTFAGATTITVPPGAPAVSDPIDLPVQALGELTVSLYLPDPTPISTFHWDGGQTAYVAEGNRVADRVLAATTTMSARLFLSSILVEAPSSTRLVVGYGDSITDGAGSTPGMNHRWPDYLAARLASDGVAVVNAGISGGRVLSDRMGANALARFERDVLGEPQLRAVILLMGINDISWPGHVFAPAERPVAVGALIAGYRQLIERAHLRGVRIVGATLTPFEGALAGTPMEGYYDVRKDSVRQEVNAWIRTSGTFDAIVDFDALLRDPGRPSRLLPRFDSGDHLHPGDAGYKAMADAIDSDGLFGAR